MVLIDSWFLEMTKEADKAFGKLDKPVKQRIINYFETRVLNDKNPRRLGKPLSGNLTGYWSYRVGDYRIIADIQDKHFVILVIDIDHRRQVYDS